MSKFAGLGLPVDQPSRMTILHPVTRRPLVDKDKNAAYIDLLSPDSEKALKFERKLTNDRLKSRGAAVTADDMEANHVDRLANATTGWRLLSLDGEPLDVPFSEANARELYDERSMRWLRDQVEQYWADRANFSKASSNG